MSDIEIIEPQPKPPVTPARETSAIKEAISGSGASSSLRIIAIGAVFAFLYFASSIVIAVLTSVLVAYFLDPLVTFLERLRIPRALGALLVLVIASTAVGALGYLAVGRLDTFVDDWPRYSAVLKRTAADVNRRLSNVDQQVSELTSQKRASATAGLENAQPFRTLLLRGLGSLYSILLVWTFLPFLVFFMLASKRRIWQSTIELFPEEERHAVQETLEQVGTALRSYIAGNLLVAAILAAACGTFFWSIHLDYPLVIGVFAGLLNLIPYLGVVLSWLPPFVIGLSHWKTAGPFLGVAGVLTGLHLVAMNVLLPAIVGRRVHLNAVAVTIALLFWGWLWGAAGLILAIPIMAVLKVVCDHVPSWQPTGRWLGS